MRSSEALAGSILRTAELSTDGGFPLITLDTFEEQASLARSSIQSPLAMWSPVLSTQNDLSDWNGYTAALPDRSISPVVFDNLMNPVPATTLPMAPIWQIDPMRENMINFNLYGVKGMREVARRVNIARGKCFCCSLWQSFIAC